MTISTKGVGRECYPYPDDASFKTIAISCPYCGTYDCWPRYLSWEKASGFTVGDNQKQWPTEVDEDHRPRHFFEQGLCVTVAVTAPSGAAARETTVPCGAKILAKRELTTDPGSVQCGECKQFLRGLGLLSD